MARPVWSGSISFVLVSVPVKLFATTKSHSIPFHVLWRRTGESFRHRRVAESTRKEVPCDDIVKGYDLGDAIHVVVEREELEAVVEGRSRMSKGELVGALRRAS